MTPELRTGLVAAVLLHVFIFYGFRAVSIPQYEVVVSPSSLEVSLVAVHVPKKKTTPLVEKQEPRVEEQKNPDEVIKTEKVEEEKEKKEIEADYVEEREVPHEKKNDLSNTLRGAIEPASVLTQKNQPPVYPRDARARGHAGTVVILLQVDTKGKVVTLEIKQSSGFLSLDQSALKAIKNWGFTPAKRLGVPVTSQLEIPVHFQLEE